MSATASPKGLHIQAYHHRSHSPMLPLSTLTRAKSTSMESPLIIPDFPFPVLSQCLHGSTSHPDPSLVIPFVRANRSLAYNPKRFPICPLRYRPTFPVDSPMARLTSGHLPRPGMDVDHLVRLCRLLPHSAHVSLE